MAIGLPDGCSVSFGLVVEKEWGGPVTRGDDAAIAPLFIPLLQLSPQ